MTQTGQVCYILREPYYLPLIIAKGIDGAFERIYQNELGAQPVKRPELVTRDFHQVTRGPERAEVYVADMTDVEVPNGTWFRADALPNNIVMTQIDFINKCVAYYKSSYAQSD